MSMSMTMTMTMTNILPHDVVMDILSRLPVKSLLRFRCVSKLWKILFNDPSFIKLHLNHSINNNNEHVMLGSSCLYSLIVDSKSSLANEVIELDYPFKTSSTNDDGFQILGSCNGLLLIITYNFLCIWNPSTKEFKKLPNTSIDYLKEKEWYIYCLWINIGFGYDKIIEDYKVVLIFAFNDGSLDVKVYTLGSDSWRRIKDIHIPGTLKLDYELGYHSTVSAGKLVNGVLHWVESRLITYHREMDFDDDEEEKKEEYSHIILSLNIEDEKFGEIQQPDFIDTKCQMNVEVLGGCLCIMCNFHHICLDIWVMKEYGVKESWTKLFTIDQPSVITCFEFLRTQIMDQLKLLCVKDNSYLFIYDSKRRSAEILEIRGLEDWFETYTYVESLISLNSGTFVGQEQAAWKRHMKNERRRDKKKKKNKCLKDWFESDTYVESLISLNYDTLVEQEQEAWKRTLKNRKKDLCFF